MDLSVIIPARNEEFLQNTIDDVLAHAKADTEVIVILDGYWPATPIPDHPRLSIIHHSQSVGQRAAVNEGARLSTAKYIMKLDAHCALADGFDLKLIEDCRPNWTVIPKMYNLHAFDWICLKCGKRTYQGPTPIDCPRCHEKLNFEKLRVWQRRMRKHTEFWYFDKNLRFRYWYDYAKRPAAAAPIADTMSFLGACFFMQRERFFDIGCLDEAHGGWGQMGTEISCKTWLSGGRLVVDKNTWFAHMFRTNSKGFSFPYPLSGRAVKVARKYSKSIWLKDAWPKAIHKLSWLVDMFAPVPDWHDPESIEQRAEGREQKAESMEHRAKSKKRGAQAPMPHAPCPMPSMTILYYTDGRLKDPLKSRVLKNIESLGFPIVKAANSNGSERSHLNMFKNILAAAQAADSENVGLAEHDCFYPKEHFLYHPPADVFCYNTNHRFLDRNGTYHTPYKARSALSGLVCNRKLLIAAVQKRIAFLEGGGKLQRGIQGACEFGIVDDYKSKSFKTKIPYIDVRHGHNFSGGRKGGDRRRFVAPWGTIDTLLGTVPPGRWYQEAVINSVAMPQRRKTDTSQNRWQKLIKPLIRGQKSEVRDQTSDLRPPTSDLCLCPRAIDLGANAGFYARKMAALGFDVMAVEKDPQFLRHAFYWEHQDPVGIKIIESDINDFEIPAAKLALLANVLYWLTHEQVTALVKKLSEKVLTVIVIGRHHPHPRHLSPASAGFYDIIFNNWRLADKKEDKKHFSLCFKNPALIEKDVEDLTFFQQFMKSRRFLPSYEKYIDRVRAGDRPTGSDYEKYLKWRGKKGVRVLLKRHADLVESMEKDGIINPLLIGRKINGRYEQNRLRDGDHRLIVAKKLGIKKVICKINDEHRV